MKRFSALSALAVAAVAAAVLAVPAMAGPGATIKTNETTPNPANPAPFQTGYNFEFFNGNGVMQAFAPTYYKSVLSSSGNENQVLKGIVANDTGATVTYSAYSGAPIMPGQTCWNFGKVGGLTTDWVLTIEANGNYTLNCHFAKA